MSDAFAPFLLGFLSTAFQTVMLREFSASFYGNELTLGIVLALWLLCGGIGSACSLRIGVQPSHFTKLYLLAIFLFSLSLFGIRFWRFLFHVGAGETTGMTPVLVMAAGTCLAVSLPLGILFALNVRRLEGRIDRVFILDSCGAASGGLVVYGVLIPILTQWQIASLIGCCAAVMIWASFGRHPFRPWRLILLLVLAAPAALDVPSQRIQWKPFTLIASQDSKQGRIQVLQTAEQITIYGNGSLISAYPDRAAAEEAVHFALLQNPEARRILLVGGGTGGSLDEILKYPQTKLDYVELDPVIISLARKFIEPFERITRDRDRIRLHSGDGRTFLRRIPDATYDAIILYLPDPSTAQLNRFYTREFFALARRKLVPGGVFSFGVSSAEHYIGPELRQFLASLFSALKDVFPVVDIVPGERNIFLASTRSLTLDAGTLADRADVLSLNNVYVHRGYLLSRLHPMRLRNLKEAVACRTSRTNRDLVPIGILYHAVLWGSQFQGYENALLATLARLRPFWLVAAPLALFCGLALFFRRRRVITALYFTPLVVMGMTTIIIEIVLLMWYQVRYGYLYGRIALLLAAFMFGLFIGALIGARRRVYSMNRLVTAQGAFVLFSFSVLLLLPLTPPEPLPFLLLFLMGGLSGEVFLVSNSLYLRKKVNYGLGYGLDLGGSFLGALATSSILIPLAGLATSVLFVLALNALCFFFLLFRPKNI